MTQVDLTVAKRIENARALRQSSKRSGHTRTGNTKRT
ncbi:hypothetical protein HNQ50_002555 [Silvimonas terrae]|uniref:Uncharacterized protein n=1 Tax=Silvimonas terrae TaxID=300266 RepID=A0A840RER7_9NEIS|nr:hypothetical protein [Silvimonas terrae]